jgi:ABC-type lipoprotein release transport system permease subunit
MADLRTLLRIAARQLFSRRVNYLVGALLVLSSALLVVITTLRKNIEAATRQTMVDGFLGHLDLFSDKGPTDPSLYALEGPGELAAMEGFHKIKERLLKIPNVESISPLGALAVDYAGGNALDRLFAELRARVNDKLAGRTPALAPGAEGLEALKAHARFVATRMAEEKKTQAAIYDPEEFQAETASLTRASSAAFWDQFDAHPLDSLEFLENKIAPLGSGEIQAQLALGAMRLANVPAAYNRIEIVDGTAIPEGRRGILLSKFIYEDTFKIKTARRLDKLKHALSEEGRKIDGDAELARWVRDNREGGPRELLVLLGPARAAKLVARLQKDLVTQESDPAKLISSLLDTNDTNFNVRYALFYQDVAPLVDLYRVHLGEPLPLSALTKTGYFRTVAVPLYGTYKFKGLDMAHPIVRELSVTDLMTFRELYGATNAAERSEIASMAKDVGGTFLDPAQAEAAFRKGQLESTGEMQRVELSADQALAGFDRVQRQKEMLSTTYPASSFENGAAVSAAIYLKDPSKAAQTLDEIRSVVSQEHLPVRVVNWLKAAGYLGTFVFVAGLLLTIAVVVIFTLVAVMLNNTLMILTLQRVREIGTLRALGASRSFVLLLVLLESTLSAAVFGGLGLLAGGGVLHWLHRIGIPAPDPDSQFFFGGPALHPTANTGVYLLTLGIVLAVCLAATLYPAQLAVRVSPLAAMQTEE